jgi:hypothetical protein
MSLRNIYLFEWNKCNIDTHKKHPVVSVTVLSVCVISSDLKGAECTFSKLKIRNKICPGTYINLLNADLLILNQSIV